MPATLSSFPPHAAEEDTQDLFEPGTPAECYAMPQDLLVKGDCIVVNYLDEVSGHDSKDNCHLFLPGQPRGILHRAVSLIVFDHEGRMLVQQRAQSKGTFPGFWANTCCSHPVHGMQPTEVDEPADVASGNPMGVKRAAVRELNHELGIPATALRLERLKFMTRVHYWAADATAHGNDTPWGEHEIVYVLVYKLADGETLDVKPNPNEVQEFKWLTRDDFRASLNAEPWAPLFRIIAEQLLESWWSDLDVAVSTSKYTAVDRIYRSDPPVEFQGAAGSASPCLEVVSQTERELDPVAQGSPTAAAAKERRLAVLKLERHAMMLGLMRKQLDASVADVKQGAYGKVKTHSHSLSSQLSRPLEVVAGIRFKFFNGLKYNCKDADADVAFCVKILYSVSRSFAAVITQLPEDICLDIMIFYLVLRALDTIEDDMEAYEGREAEKKAELRSFGQKRLADPSFSMDGVGAGDERLLLQRFGAVARVFRSLPQQSQEVIRDITDRMGAGMASFVDAEMAQGTADQASYDLYCHMVAGLVGEGLTRIFVARGVESASLTAQGERIWPFCADAKKETSNMGLANSMGLFLQKANIIRDYLEDYVDGRAFWPKTVWRKYSKTDDLGEFARPTAHGAGRRGLAIAGLPESAMASVGEQALLCLNDLVADALELVPDCLEYLARLKEPAVYRFCAIPQVMAIATLAECFDNPRLFTGVVKIRKGLTCRLINACCSAHGQDAVKWWFGKFARDIESSVDSGVCAGARGPVGDRLRRACRRIQDVCKSGCEAEESRGRRRWGLALGLGAVAAAFAVCQGIA